MKRPSTVGIILYALFFLALTTIASPEYRSDRILVKPKHNVLPQRIAAQHAALRARVHRQYPRFGGWQVITLPRGLSVEKALERYRRSGLFEKVQPDFIRHITAAPNDPSFPASLYGLIKIGCTNAWAIRSNAESVVVAVIDTGARLDHEDLASNLWVNVGEIPDNGIDDDNDGYIDDVHGINAITGSGDPSDDNSHGTHTAGTVGAVGNNGVGVVGVAWRVQLMILKFIAANGNGDDAGAVECIDYAIAHGAHILSNSWGGPGDSPAIYDAVLAARNAGIIFVAAAGNNGADNDAKPFIPASFDLDNVVSVAATDSSDNRAGFSNYGRDSVDLGAPGVSTFSTLNSSTNAYGFKSGTSMATPHVAGALALVKAEFPTETYTQLIHRVLGTVDPVPALSNITVTGGRLNVFRALTETPVPVADFGAQQLGGYVVTFTNTTIGTFTNLTWSFGDGSPADIAQHPTHTYTNAGSYDVTLSVAGVGGATTRTRSISVGNNYYLRPTTYSWIDPTDMTQIALEDDSTSDEQTLPFEFVYYGQTNTTVYVGSNGILGFDPTGLSSPAHAKLPNPAAPNNALCPYWADLYPGTNDLGIVYVGTTGAPPNRVEVISWVGVPHYNDISATFDFQVLLYESTHDIVFQYREVQPANTGYGASKSATVGIENPDGTIARTVSFDRSTALTNNEALLFTLTPPAPTLTGSLPSSPATNLNPVAIGNTLPLATIQIFASSCAEIPLATGNANDAGLFATSVPVTTNSTTAFFAQAIDTAGNTSTCSSAIGYVQLDPAGDADGDGFSNLDELNAGTDPLNSGTFPRTTTVTNGSVQVQSVAGKTYQLQRRDALETGMWDDIGTPVAGDGSLLTLTDPDVADMPHRFYRVKISQ